MLCPSQAVLGGVEKILEFALQLDPGKFLQPTCKTILFAIRLAARVLDYIAFILSHSAWVTQQSPVSGLALAGPDSWIRGLDGTDADALASLKGAQKRLKDQLQGRAYDMLEAWRMKVGS